LEYDKKKYTDLANNAFTAIKDNDKKSLINIEVSNKTLSVTPDHLFLTKHISTGEIKEIEAGVLADNFEDYLLPI